MERSKLHEQLHEQPDLPLTGAGTLSFGSSSEMVNGLVAGETLGPPDPFEGRGGWLRVVVPGHPSSLDEQDHSFWVSLPTLSTAGSID